jgi:hypothetical protein
VCSFSSPCAGAPAGGSARRFLTCAVSFFSASICATVHKHTTAASLGCVRSEIFAAVRVLIPPPGHLSRETDFKARSLFSARFCLARWHTQDFRFCSVLTDSVFTAVPSFAAPSLAQLVSSRVSAAAGGGVVCDFMASNFRKICV